jgi:hypothetical protein
LASDARIRASKSDEMLSDQTRLLKMNIKARAGARHCFTATSEIGAALMLLTAFLLLVPPSARADAAAAAAAKVMKAVRSGEM